MNLTIKSQKDCSIPFQEPGEEEDITAIPAGHFRFHTVDSFYFDIPLKLVIKLPWIQALDEAVDEDENVYEQWASTTKDLLKVYIDYLSHGYVDLAGTEYKNTAQGLYFLAKLETGGELFPSREFSNGIIDHAFDFVTTRKWKAEDEGILTAALCLLSETKSYKDSTFKGLKTLLSDVLLFKVHPQFVRSITKNLPEEGLRFLLLRLRQHCSTLGEKYRTLGEEDGEEVFVKEFGRHLSFSTSDYDFKNWLAVGSPETMSGWISIIVQRLSLLSTRFGIKRDIKEKKFYYVIDEDIDVPLALVLLLQGTEIDGNDADDDHIDYEFPSKKGDSRITNTPTRTQEKMHTNATPGEETKMLLQNLNELHGKFIQCILDYGKSFMLDAALLLRASPGITWTADFMDRQEDSYDDQGFKMYIHNVDNDVFECYAAYLTNRTSCFPWERQRPVGSVQKKDLLFLVKLWSFSNIFWVPHLQNRVIVYIWSLLQDTPWELEEMEIVAEVISYLYMTNNENGWSRLELLRKLMLMVATGSNFSQWNRLSAWLHPAYLLDLFVCYRTEHIIHGKSLERQSKERQEKRMARDLSYMIRYEDPCPYDEEGRNYDMLCISNSEDVFWELPIETKRVVILRQKEYFWRMKHKIIYKMDKFLVPDLPASWT